MKTSAISNLANLTSGTATSAKNAGEAADSTFSNMLSREMATPPKPSEPMKAEKPQNSKEPEAARPESATSDAKSTQPSEASTAQDSATRPAKTDKADASPAAKADDDKDQDDDTTVSAESEQLLALVASLTQAPAKATDAKTVDDTEQAALDASGDGAKPDGQAKDLSLIAQAASAANIPRGLALGQAETPSTATAAEVPSVTGQSRRESGLLRAAAATSGAARRDIGNGPGERTVAKDTTGELPSEPKEFDAKLANARDEKPATENSTGKTQPGRAEFIAAQSADRPAPKPAQDAPQPTIAPLAMNTVSPAQVLPVQAMAAQAADMLAPRVGSQGWDQALSQKVVWMVGSDVQSASLTLNPPDLGPLQVVLQVSDNQATANFTAAQPEVRHALEAAMPKLREMLGDAGIQLSQANVNAGNPNNHPHNAFEQPQQSSRQGATAPNESSEAPPVRVARTQTISTREGLVDTFA